MRITLQCLSPMLAPHVTFVDFTDLAFEMFTSLANAHNLRVITEYLHNLSLII